ncbi:MAG: MerR family transcriptional regulator [Lachnospiraceae bacterium]|nr:MerR family transcriptional regulator [Lachnospiraceae bacterium]
MQKFQEPCIKTGEFARLCNTNKRTLFHYDEIGLFSPAYTDEKGYRYYSESQCDVFFTISCLREIGMPLKEIKKYVDERNPSALKELLEEQYKKVKEEQERLNRIEQVITTKLSLVQLSESPKVSSSSQKVLLEESPEEYFIISPRLDTDDHDILIHAVCEHIGYCYHNGLNAGHPYGAMVSTSALLEENWDTYAHFCTKILDPTPEHPMHVKPAGLYAVAYLKGNYYKAEEVYRQLLAFIQEHDLEMGEFCYKEAVLDELAVKDEAEYITKISIPVRERNH